jgi:hypothetical protein
MGRGRSGLFMDCKVPAAFSTLGKKRIVLVRDESLQKKVLGGHAWDRDTEEYKGAECFHNIVFVFL